MLYWRGSDRGNNGNININILQLPNIIKKCVSILGFKYREYLHPVK